MDLRSIANVASSAINQNTTVGIMRSTGYVIGSGHRQVPTYSPAIFVPAQIQALDGEELKKLDGINLQGTIRSIFLKGSLSGVIKPDGTGGDIVSFGGKTWLVVKVIERWAGWTKAAIVLQDQ